MVIIPQYPIFPYIKPKPWVTTVVMSKTETKVPQFKPKKAGTETAHVVFVLDDSFSMQSCRKQTIDGFNEFLKGQQQSDVKTYISLYKFDGANVNQVLSRVDSAKVEPINENTYNPQGSTNLLDAIGSVIVAVNDQLTEVKKKNRDSVTIVVLTDGEENSSRSYDNQAIKGMVEKAEGKQWSFMFLGANIDAFATGSTLGFSHHNTIQYSTTNTAQTIRSASRMASDMSTLKSKGLTNEQAYASAAFTDQERNEASE